MPFIKIHMQINLGMNECTDLLSKHAQGKRAFPLHFLFTTATFLECFTFNIRSFGKKLVVAYLARALAISFRYIVSGMISAAALL